MTDDIISRRRYLLGTGAGALAMGGLAGCLEEGIIDDGGGGQDGDVTGTLEIVHWWTAGGEEEALSALLEGYQEEHPDVEIDDNPAPGGAGAAIDAVIQTRVIDQDPPSTFQIWPGESLRPYTDADVLADVSDLWTDEMHDAYLDTVEEAASPAGTLVAVPLNIHRLNNLFYNVEVVEDAGIDPDGLEDGQAVLDAFAAADEAGYTGLAQQTSEEWGTLQLWESVLIAEHGVDTFEQFIGGGAADVEDEIRETLQLVDDYREYFSPDAGAIAWDEANAQLIAGDAAFHHQGDWAAGQYEAEGFEYGEQWDYVPFPGTDGVYEMVMDSFVMPEPNPSPEATEAFLSYCGTVEAQETFNQLKGSIPPRTDVPTDEYPPFLQDQMSDFQDSEDQPTTIAHGSAVRPEIKSAVEEEFSIFIEDWDVDRATDGLIDAVQDGS